MDFGSVKLDAAQSTLAQEKRSKKARTISRDVCDGAFLTAIVMAAASRTGRSVATETIARSWIGDFAEDMLAYRLGSVRFVGCCSQLVRS